MLQSNSQRVAMAGHKSFARFWTQLGCVQSVLDKKLYPSWNRACGGSRVGLWTKHVVSEGIAPSLLERTTLVSAFLGGTKEYFSELILVAISILVLWHSSRLGHVCLSTIGNEAIAGCATRGCWVIVALRGCLQTTTIHPNTEGRSWSRRREGQLLGLHAGRRGARQRREDRRRRTHRRRWSPSASGGK